MLGIKTNFNYSFKIINLLYVSIKNILMKITFLTQKYNDFCNSLLISSWTHIYLCTQSDNILLWLKYIKSGFIQIYRWKKLFLKNVFQVIMDTLI